MHEQGIRLISDGLLLEKIALIDAVFYKQAGILDSLWNTVQRHVVSKIDTSSAGALTASVADILVPGILFTVSRTLGVATVVASKLFGFNFDHIWNAIAEPARDKLQKGEKVNPQELDNAAQSLLQSEGVDAPVTASGSLDLFRDIRAIEERGELFKSAQLFGGRGQGSGLSSIFRKLGQGRVFAFLVGIALWFIKRILLGAGLLVGAGVALDLVGIEDKQKSKKTEMGAGMAKQPPPLNAPPPTRHNLQPSGRGQKMNKNDPQNLWIVPLYGDVRNTLLLWALDVYPELQGHENIIRNTPAFNRTVNLLDSYIDMRNPHYLIMPKGIHRIIDIVDIFAGDVAKQIKPEKGKE